MSLQSIQEKRLKEKKERLAKAILELIDYARSNNGAFFLFGSAIGDRFALHSDVDLIADFGDFDGDIKGFDAATTILAKYDLEIDGVYRSMCTKKFIDEISQTWRVLK